MTLKSKTLFIAGASRGMCLAIAKRAAADGAGIVIAAKTTQPNPKLPGTIYTAATEIEAAGGRALPHAVDIREEGAVLVAVAKAVESFGEDRWKTVGLVEPALLALVYTVRGEDRDVIRLISARKADAHERAQYREIQT